MGEARKKILFFDIWAYGKGCIGPLMKELSTAAEVLYVGNDCQISTSLMRDRRDNLAQYRKRRELECADDYLDGDIDLKEYGGSFVRLLTALKPDVVVVISSHGVEQRHLVFVCDQLGIPTVLVMHGVREHSADAPKPQPSLWQKMQSVQRTIRRSLYYVKRFSTYMADRIRLLGYSEILRVANWRDCCFLFLRHRAYVLNPPQNDQFEYDLVSVTSDLDKKYFNNNYGIGKGAKPTKFVKHYSFDLSNVLGDDRREMDPGLVVFVSQPVVSHHLMSEQGFSLLIESLADACKSCGMELVVRPHPRDDITILEKLQRQFKFELSEESMQDDFWRSAVMVGINSSLLYSAAVMRKRVIAVDCQTYPLTAVLRAEKLEIVEFCEQQALLTSRLLETLTRLTDLPIFEPPKLQKPESFLSREILGLASGSRQIDLVDQVGHLSDAAEV